MPARLYTGSVRNHPTAWLRQLPRMLRRYEVYALNASLVLGIGSLVYLAVR